MAKKVVVLLLFTITMLAGCGSSTATKIANQSAFADQALRSLSKQLDSARLRNASILRQYSKIVKKQRPELTPLLDQLALDASSKGPLFTSLRSRLDKAVNQPGSFIDDEQRLKELYAIRNGADPLVFDDALSDPVNVVADLSQGSLARVNAISKQDSQVANQSKDYGNGSQLIGNQHYGQWQRHSNGTSFWAWYGMYSMFSNVMGGRNRIFYNDWHRNRDYSYYQDYGRRSYASPDTRRKTQNLETNRRKRFGDRSPQKSSYSRKAGASGLASRSRNQASGNSRFGSSRFSNNSSLRRSADSSSRGVRRGK